MACFHPSKVGILRKKIPNKPRIWIDQTVPCGHCGGCRSDQARDWTIRLMHESTLHETAWFLTLTYAEMPEHGSLIPSHLQRFFKTLRKRQEEPLRYFACGEYGDKHQRPHYHAVLYGVDLLDKYPIPAIDRPNVWRSPSVESAWKHGLSEFGTVTNASCAYVAGYVQKKVSKRVNPGYYDLPFVNKETGEIPTRVPEFTRMSLRPAIGKNWLLQYWSDVYPRDYVVMGGKEYKPPRYYDKLMENENVKFSDISLDSRYELMMHVREKRINDAKELSEYELHAREKAHEAKQALFNRRGH